MRCRLSSLLLIAPCAVSLVQAQGTKPKEKASDYPVHSQLQGFEIGAEYLVHSVPAERGVIDASDYLVVEIAVFPAAHKSAMLNSGEFTLRMNGKKSVLFTQAPGMVAASVKYPDWETRPALEATDGIGDTGVILGRPPVAGRFPGDNRPAQSRLPPRPQTSPSGENKPSDTPIEEIIARAALPEGSTKAPVSGCLFFAFKGKTKSIHSLELVYRSGDGSRETALRFF